MIRLAGMMILMVLAASVWAGNFSVKLDKPEVALGQMVTLTIEAEDMKSTLESLDIQPLAADFEISNVSSSRYTEKRGRRSINHQQMEVALFPTHTGEIKVPSFIFDGRKSLSVFLNVLDSNATVPRVLIKSGVTANKLYQREESLLYVDAYHDGTLQWRGAPKVMGTGFYLRRLPDRLRQETVDGVVFTVKRYSWGVTPLGFGTLAITFSNMEAGKFGERLRYRVPTIARDVQPVPAYLPVYLHVGKISISSPTLPPNLEIGHPVQWIMELRGKGLSVDGLRKFLVLPSSDRSLFFYPPDITIAGASESDPGMQVARITIPVKPLESGMAQFPGIRIPYYDPEDQKLGEGVLDPKPITIVNPVWGYVKKGLFFMGALVLGFFLIKRIIPIFRAWLDRRRWIRSLKMAPNPEVFYGILRKEAGRFFFEESESTRQQLHKLDKVCYGHDNDHDFNRLKLEIIASLYKKTATRQPASLYHKNVSVLFNPPYP